MFPIQVEAEPARPGVNVIANVTACPPTDVARRIVIIGGGYAGTTLAVRLGRELKRRPRPGVEVLLVETSPCQQALSELDLVAAGTEKPEFCELWLPAVLKNLPVRTCFNRAESIDLERQTITLRDGQQIDYWRLVIASGAVPHVPPVPGLAEHAITMWSVSDAQKLQSRLRQQMKAAAAMPRAEDRRHALSVTVCGGGATGVEVVGSLGQLLPKRAAEIGLDASDLNIHLVEGQASILPNLPEPQQRKALSRLSRLGVEVATGSMVAHVEDEHIVLADERKVPGAVLVWCGGARPDPHAAVWGLPLESHGRIRVGADCKVDGLSDVYALGDVAAATDPRTGHTLPMLAQFAIVSGKHAARNIIAEMNGMPTTPFMPHLLGEFVSVGPSWGVGWMLRLRLSGIPAIVMKRMTYVLYWWQVGGVSLAIRRSREMAGMQR